MLFCQKKVTVFFRNVGLFWLWVRPISVERRERREEKELPDGGVQVTYYGAGNMVYALGTYTVVVKDGKAAEVSWSHDGKDTSGGYAAEAWGLEQLDRKPAENGLFYCITLW